MLRAGLLRPLSGCADASKAVMEELEANDEKAAIKGGWT